MAKKRKKATTKPVPVPVTKEYVFGWDNCTGKRIFAKPGTPGFTPDK